MSAPMVATRELGVVIITRNEATRIARCIESILQATARSFADTDIVVVDSDSSDDTTTIASRYPVRVFRYRARRMSAAAGRWIGSQHVDGRYILFIDGDCELVPGWLETAIAHMETDATAGVICGARRNAHVENGRVEVSDGGNDLGGTALYRRDALVRCKGFNPFIVGSEEQELRVRLEACGFHARQTMDPMSVHHTGKKESIAGMWRRHRSGMQSGPGQVLRVALRDGLFRQHAQRFDRYLLTFVFLASGVIATVLALFGHDRPIEEWAVVGIAGFLLLAWRRRSMRDAGFIILDWISVAVGSAWTFVKPPRAHEEFVYTLERVAPAMVEPTAEPRGAAAVRAS
ncbi:MAG: glycosyltransferase [Deltaproteobacteria bacterium]|nr:glycosyltransferase [Deltaproteobacteria bacterium]